MPSRRASQRWSRALRLAAGLLALGAGPLGAQDLPIEDVAEEVFDSRSGLRAMSVFAIHRDTRGTLWAGTSNGPAIYAGGNWVMLERFPVRAATVQVRDILEDADGTLWFALRGGGVVRLHDRDWTTLDTAQGLPDQVVYALAESRAIDARPRVAVGTASGAAWFDGERFRALVPPRGFSARYAMVRELPGVAGEPVLWIASADRGLAAYQRGRWRVFGEADGLPNVPIEDVLAATGERGVAAYAVTQRGLYALPRDTAGGARWRPVADSPDLAYRAIEVPAPGGTELWVGTASGTLHRRLPDGRWREVLTPTLRRRLPISELRHVPGHGGGTAVYVGLYGGRVVRLSVGIAGSLLLERAAGHRYPGAVLLDPPAVGGGVWIGTTGYGLLHVTPAGSRTYDRRDGLRGLVMTNLMRDRRGTLWVATDSGPAVLEGGRWVLRRDGFPLPQAVHVFHEPAAGDATTALLAGTMRGLYAWDGRAWRADSVLGQAAIYGLLDVTGLAAGPVTVAATGHGLFQRDAGGWRELGPPRAAGEPRGVHALCQAPDGALWIVLEGGAVLRRRPGQAGWATLGESASAALGDMVVRGIHCLSQRRAWLATERGAMLLDADAAEADGAVRALVTEAEGLPTRDVVGFAGFDAAGRLWARTAHGVGPIDTAAAALRAPRAELVLRLIRHDDGTRVSEGQALPHDARDLRLDLALLTNHRETENTFRVALAGPTRTVTEWTTQGSYDFRGLGAGRYVLEAWGRDALGRVTGPARRQFAIATAPWRSPLALAGYAAALVLLVLLAHSWRLRQLRARALVLAESEKRVRASERKFKALFDRAADAHLLVEGDAVVDANARALALFGVPSVAALATRRVHELIAGRGEAQLGTATPVETVVRAADGREVPVSVLPTPIRVDERLLVHVMLRDLTLQRAAAAEREQLAAQVREKQRLEALGTLAGGVAHDFNNLLAVIRGNAELARAEAAPADGVREHLDAVLAASERARDLVRQILTFSRRSPARRDAIDLAALVRELEPMLRALIPRTVEIVLDLAPGGAVVLGDPAQLQQMLLNLCSNAEYAMRPTHGGRLTVRVARVGEGDAAEALLAVSDTGVGMSAEVRERLFEPFFTTKPLGEGTGLGLAVLHGIVETHGGRVEVESAPGRGTRFEVRLPIARAVPVPAAPAAEPPPPDDGTAPAARVLLVDDEEAVARVLARALARAGYAVTTFGDPRGALAHLRAAPQAVDLLITDQTMPGMTGDQLIAEVRMLRADLPILLSTGFSHRLAAPDAPPIDVQGILFKPIPLDELRDAVARALRGERVGE